MQLVDGGSGWLACGPYPVRFTVADAMQDHRVLAKFAQGSVEVQEVRAGENLVVYPDGAVAESGFASAFSDSAIVEGKEHGKQFTIQLVEKRFIGTTGEPSGVIEPAAVRVPGLPNGVSIGAVERENDQRLKVSLEGNASAGYDRDIPLLRVVLDSSAIERCYPPTAVSPHFRSFCFFRNWAIRSEIAFVLACSLFAATAIVISESG